MVFDHIARMEQLDDSHRAEYGMALKHAAVTAFIGKISLARKTDSRISLWVNVRFCRDGL
jgi:hypothetical protein